MIEPIRIAGAAAHSAAPAASIAATLLAASRVGGSGVVNTALLAARFGDFGRDHPKEAAAVARDLNLSLPAADQHRFQTDLRNELAERNLPVPDAADQ